MQSSTPRRGIEWKILRSILWVGILPLALALAVGFLTAHEGQSNAVVQTLLVAAQGKAQALRLATEFRLHRTGVVGREPPVIGALLAGPDGRPRIYSDPEAAERVRARLDQESEKVEQTRATWVLYDAQGNPLLATQPFADPNAPHSEWSSTVRGPRLAEVLLLPGSASYAAQAVAPVQASEQGPVLGYLSQVYELDAVLRFAVVDRAWPAAPSADGLNYQLIYDGPRATIAVLLARQGASDSPLVVERVDPTLQRLLRGSGGGTRGAYRLRAYQAGGRTRDAFVAYERLGPDQPAYLVAYRPASAVFRNVYLGALGALVGCSLFIGFLCLNSYRHVHNNIVRPVLLLNEGAQIIGQGDLELKLKVGTGDEIEELASSFNKMALALKGNIRQLEESEEKYRSLVTSMRDGIFQTGRNGTIGFLNPAGVEILGYTQVDEVVGKNLGSMFLQTEEMRPILAELSRSGFVERSRVWMKRRDGRAICVELTANLVQDDAGKVVGIEGLFRDVTKGVRLEREARDRAERLSAINQIANVINSSLEAGRLYESLVVEIRKLVDFDYAALALLREQEDAFQVRRLWPEQEPGTGVTQALGDERSLAAWVARRRQRLVVRDLRARPETFSDVFPEGIRSCVAVPLYATGRIIGTLNLGAKRADGFSRHDVEVLEQMAPHIAVAIRNAHLLENLQQSLVEVTRAREELHKANEELKTLDEVKTNLLSNVSHELRTPLVSIMGYTDMIYNGKVGPINDTQKEYMGISLRNVDKLVTLIENLLDFSRLHRGAETLAFDTFDIIDCARASIQVVRPVADSREIAVALESDAPPILVEGDKGKLGQVFTNLLANAVKFNHNGGSVTVDIRTHDDTVECAVTDTGIGIPPEALDKVFTRFYQYDSSSTRKYGGTGIGLSIAQDIIRLHGGRIVVSSEVGKGSTFRFSLPLTRGRRDEAKGATGLALPTETRVVVGLLTRDRALGTQVRNLLEPEGMEVLHAVSAGHAVDLVRRHRPDCVLVDVESPGEGTAPLDALLSNPELEGVPLVVLTNDETLYEHYRPLVSNRIRRSFRKSSLLGGIHFALTRGPEPAESVDGRILCVDDDPEILTFMRRCFEAEGLQVDTCRTGEEALQLVAKGGYVLICLDIAMPGIDGWETCRRIKGMPGLQGTLIYMVTAKPVDNSAARARQAGADGYLFKPFRAEDLTELVQGIGALRAAREH